MQQGSTHPHLLVLCTCPDQTSAERIATTLVQESLAACVNISPGIHSVYRWEGRVEQTQEILLLIKSTGSVYNALETRIQELHPYELPEIIAVPIIQGAQSYLEWINSMTSTKP